MFTVPQKLYSLKLFELRIKKLNVNLKWGRRYPIFHKYFLRCATMQTWGPCSRRLCFAASFPAGMVGRCLHMSILTPWNTSAPPSLHSSYSHISPFWVSHRAPVHSVCLSSRSPYVWLLHSASDFCLSGQCAPGRQSPLTQMALPLFHRE